MDKQMIKYACILGGLLFIVVVFFLITGAGGQKYEYRDMELMMVRAARQLAAEDPKVLPTAENSSQTISAKRLMDGGYLDNLSDMAMDETTCSGEVEIFQTKKGIYNYVPQLNCGKYWTTQKLADKIVEDNLGGTVQGPGLYVRYDGEFITDENDLDRFPADEYVFRGEGVKNYIKIEETIWRVVAITADGDILAILTNDLSKNSSWDNRYNTEVNKSEGINEYELNGIKSRAMQAAINVFEEKTGLIDGSYSARIKYLASPMELCYGKRATKDEGNDGKLECDKKTSEIYMGLLPAYYYMSASLDENCVRTTSKSCGNYNYLASIDDSSWWTSTANSDNTNEAYVVTGRVLKSETCSFPNEIKPVMLIGKRAAWSKGTGTKDDPYIIRYFKKNA